MDAASVTLVATAAVAGGVLAASLLAWWRTRRVGPAATTPVAAACAPAWFVHAPTPLCLCDAHGAIVDGNQEFRRLLLVSPDHPLAGARLQELLAGGPADSAFAPATDAPDQTEGAATALTATLRRRDGSELPIRITVARLPAGGSATAICSLIDNTDMRRTEGALQAAEREAVVGRMAARVAHEVNNPLEAIKIYIEPLRRRVHDLPEVDHGLVVIDQQVDRIARLVKALLGFVRQRTRPRATVPVTDLVSTVVDLFQPRFDKKNRRLEVVLPSDNRAANVDVDGVQQVLINLLENGLAAAPAGGWVRIEADCCGSCLHIRVSDNGPGLGPDPERLFRPYTTTKSDGTGLGLPVARRICRNHQGSLTGSNRSDGGALFEAILRLDTRSSQRTPRPTQQGGTAP